MDEMLNESLERFWIQENQGILPPREVSMSRNDMHALETMEKGTKLLKGRYEVPMLWSSPHVMLPNNISLAKKRFTYLERRLRTNKTLHKGFKAVIDGYLTEDPPVARKMTKDEAERTSSRSWYLPMHPVMKKPGKIRIVNDAAASYQNTCLNNALITGPNLLNSLVGILIRFRMGRIAISADVKDFFHRVRVSKEDADSLRFLWKEDIFSQDPPETYQMLVHIFGAADSPACANYALKRNARENAEKFNALTLESVLRNFYMDDLLKSVENEEEAIELAKELMAMLQCGSFRLTNYLSNSRKVLTALPSSEVSPSAIMYIDVEKKERALGVSWDTSKDVFTFPTQLKEAKPTKRGILSTASSLVDPLGFLAPFILKAKLILQELWRKNYGWDDEVDENTMKCWMKWMKRSSKLSAMKLSRRYTLDERLISEIQLHIFCDASEVAYGSVAYLRISTKSGDHTCSFVMSKSRVAHIKSITLPRLELNAALIGARMARMIVHELDYPIERITYWSDSMLALQYTKSTTHWMKIFVANRVTEILDLTEAEQWKHIPGESNPADILSRGVLDPEILESSNWYTGPAFLLRDEVNWPKTDVQDLPTDNAELKKKQVLIALETIKPSLIDVTRISSYVRLRRIFAFVNRFVNNCRRSSSDRYEGEFSAEEISTAERIIVKQVQKEAFGDEIKILKSNGQLPKSSQLMALNPFLDDDSIIRVGGRLGKLDLPSKFKHPQILPGSHQVSSLLAEMLHRKNGHVGTEHVLSLLRQEFWSQSNYPNRNPTLFFFAAFEKPCDHFH